MRASLRRWLVLLFCLSMWLSEAGASSEKAKEAELDIAGYGLFGNIELKRTLKSLDLRWKEREFFDANFVEDAALVILSRVRRDGFLRPQVTAELTLRDGSAVVYDWHERIEPPLPRELEVAKVEFRVDEGVLYQYEDVRFSGLQELSIKEARGFFIERGVLLPLKRTRIYTPDRLEGSIANLTEVLMRRGYELASVQATNVVADHKTGKVNLEILVDEGRKSMVRSIRSETSVSTNAEPIEVLAIETNVPFSRIWQQDYSQAVRASNYHLGYPDTTVEITALERLPLGDLTMIDLLARVRTGERISLRDVKYEGLVKTKKSVLDRRIDLPEGHLLDRVEVEKGRHRLARLGVFDTVNLRYDIVDEHTRDVIYTVKEAKRLNTYLLFGYGSYELARIGVELEQFNVWGRAHRSRLRAVQSMKATSVDYRYTMPEFIGENVDVFANAFYLNRQEIDFRREEYGGGAGAKTFFDNIASDFSARYNYQVLSAFEALISEGPTNAAVGSIILDLRHDQRDSPIYPQRGYKILTSLELASQVLGGDVNFARFETQGSYHQPLDAGRWLHFGATHGVAYTIDDSLEELPFNKRFFPGGDNSVRGFQFGEAAPRNEFGLIVGAETFTSSSFEFEQALTDKFSLVLFVDAIGMARRLEDYPFNEYLVSSGGGLRWKTIIGPVRAEYGYNVLRRDEDPMGTFHLSIGFPF